MTNRIGGILALAAALTGLAQVPQPNPENLTDGLYNGRLWQQFGIEGKLTYLLGVEDGQVIGFGDTTEGYATPAKAQEAFRKARTSVIGPHGLLSHADIIKGIDKLYDDPANVVLPIVVVLKVFVLRAGGATPQAVETLLARYRRFYSKPAS